MARKFSMQPTDVSLTVALTTYVHLPRRESLLMSSVYNCFSISCSGFF